ncbi:MAG: M20/M25/M40 family metallo-hydrolase [Anaerolineae bacterium]|nr:M20/M25/M40 family metallo-hydrolase [Anaerolineae bacterium]
MDIAQRVEALSRSPYLESWWARLDDSMADLLAEAIRIQQIPAPTFHEHARAEYVMTHWEACGLTDRTLDDHANAFGRLPGTDPTAPPLLISAHTDTVFNADTDLTIRREADGRICGPGLGDNSLGVAGLVTLAAWIQRSGIPPRRDVWFLANSCEEGLGNLDGIRAFYESHAGQIGRAIVLEGMALGHVYHAGIGVRRLRLTCRAEGGHSWYNYGQPSAVHDLLRLGTRLTRLAPPATPRTTFNIGLIEGGHSINSLATSASLYLDLRSEDPAALAAIAADVLTCVAASERETGRPVEVEVIGERPSGYIPVEHELVRGAVAALRAVEIEAHYERGSTDANLLLAAGVPTVTIGLTHGGQAHRLDEFIQPAPLRVGMKQVCLLALAAAEWEPPAPE